MKIKEIERLMDYTENEIYNLKEQMQDLRLKLRLELRNEIDELMELDKANFNIKELVIFISKFQDIDITEVNRKQEYVWARQVYCFIAKENGKESLLNIGKAINRDHSTVIYNIKKHKQLSEFDYEYKAFAGKIINHFNYNYAKQNKEQEAAEQEAV